MQVNTQKQNIGLGEHSSGLVKAKVGCKIMLQLNYVNTFAVLVICCLKLGLVFHITFGPHQLNNMFVNCHLNQHVSTILGLFLHL